MLFSLYLLFWIVHSSFYVTFHSVSHRQHSFSSFFLFIRCFSWTEYFNIKLKSLHANVCCMTDNHHDDYVILVKKKSLSLLSWVIAHMIIIIFIHFISFCRISEAKQLEDKKQESSNGDRWVFGPHPTIFVYALHLHLNKEREMNMWNDERFVANWN